MTRQLSGLGAWAGQRLSAVYMTLYVPVMGLLLLWREPGYAGWIGLMTHPVVLIGNVLFALAIIYHAWVGIRDVVLDYVKPVAVRLGMLALAAATAAVLALWVLRIFVELVVR